MASKYPTALDDSSSLPNPASSSAPNSPSHALLHDNENGGIIAAQTKLGTGASVPALNTFLIGTGAGTSAWTTMTSAQVAASVSDETGSGSLVFATSPTLVTPKVDTISESTLNNGVTVGGVGLKAGAVTGTLASSNAITTANITDSNVTPAKLLAGTGTTWPFTSYTPTLVNLTIGNGTIASYYKQTGKMAAWYGKIAFGSTTAVTGAATVSLPVNAISQVADFAPLGSGSYLDSSAGVFYQAFPYKTPSLQTMTLDVWKNTGSPSFISNQGGISSSAPFTWAVNDLIMWNVVFEVA